MGLKCWEESSRLKRILTINRANNKGLAAGLIKCVCLLSISDVRLSFSFPGDLASVVEEDATTGGTTAASTAPAVATCGAPTAGATGPVFSRNGAKLKAKRQTSSSNYNNNINNLSLSRSLSQLRNFLFSLISYFCSIDFSWFGEEGRGGGGMGRGWGSWLLFSFSCWHCPVFDGDRLKVNIFVVSMMACILTLYTFFQPIQSHYKQRPSLFTSSISHIHVSIWTLAVTLSYITERET